MARSVFGGSVAVNYIFGFVSLELRLPSCYTVSSRVSFIVPHQLP